MNIVLPYVGVPPDHDEVNDTDCPLSIVGLEGLIDGVPNAEFTTTSLFML